MTTPAPADLTPATDDETEFALSFALRFDGRKHHHRADETMARLVAAHLNRHLQQSGFVIMKKPPGRVASIVSAPGWQPNKHLTD